MRRNRKFLRSINETIVIYTFEKQISCKEMPRDLRSYLELLDSSGLLLRVEWEVDPLFELSAVVKAKS
jgi:hypothetical protein